MNKILIVLAALLTAPHAAAGLEQNGNNIRTENRAFKPGEKLTFNISWSNVFKAGVAVMEVSEEKRPDGRIAFRLTSTARSAGIVSTFYSLLDTVHSVLDAEELYSLSYSLNQKHGKRKKRRELAFDQAGHTVLVSTDGREDTYTVPARVQDSLSSLYYVRTRPDLTPGSNMLVDVFDSDKTWSVEVQVLEREKIKTPVGEFDAIMVKTYPKYEGVFQHKGEIHIWFTDDERRIPVLMKSKISIGSIVATLVEMRTGEEGK